MGYLVLRRKPGEGITLRLPDGGRIHISVSEFGGARARVAIDAPATVQVMRDELVELAPVAGVASVRSAE